MALAKVRPGDLITAGTFNSLVDELERLAKIVDELNTSPGNGDPIIDDVLFSGTLREGDPIEIDGRNFRYSAGAQFVSFDDVQVTAFGAGSSDLRLLVNVPFLGLPQNGRNVKLRVANGIGSSVRTLFILPINLATGDEVLDVLWAGQTPTTASPGQDVTLSYLLRSRVAAPLTVKISPTVSGGGVTWSSNQLQILNETGTQVVADGTFQLSALGSANFQLKLSVPTTASGTIALQLQARSGTMFGGDSRSVELGVASTPSDPTITLATVDQLVLDATTGLPAPADAGKIDLGTSTIQLKAGFIGKLTVRGEFQQQGTYNLEAKTTGSWQQSSDGGVSFLIADATVTRSLVIQSSDFSGNKAAKNVDLLIRAGNGATAGTLTVRLFRQGATSEQKKTLALSVLT